MSGGRKFEVRVNWTAWALPLALGYFLDDGYAFLVIGPVALEWRVV